MQSVIGVKLDEATRARLKAVGTVQRRSTHWLMREAISQFLEREEATLRRARESVESWEHYQATGEHVSHAEMSAWLDTWGTDQEGSCPTPHN